MSSKVLIIAAAGAGKRMQRECPKPFIKIAGKTILAHTLSCFLTLSELREIVVATSVDYIELTESILDDSVPHDVAWRCVEGGTERQHSIHNALNIISDSDLILVHDAVRPFVTFSQLKQCCDVAAETGAAVLGVPSKDTIKRVDDEFFVQQTPDRKYMWQAQTPQVFRAGLLKRAYRQAAKENYRGTDDASLVEWMGKPVKMIEGSPDNIKLTYPRDLKMAKIILSDQGMG